MPYRVQVAKMKVVTLKKMDRYFSSTFVKGTNRFEEVLLSCLNHFKKDTMSRGQRDDLKVNSTACSSRRAEIESNTQHADSQTPVTPASGDSTAFSDLLGFQAHTQCKER